MRNRVQPITTRQLAQARGVLLCTTPGPACRKEWGNGTHINGRVDSFGYIHWRDITIKDGRTLYHWLRLEVEAKDRQLRSLPEWQRLYVSCTRAGHILRDEYHRRALVHWTAKERERTAYLAKRHGIALRYRHVPIYQWVYEWTKKKRSNLLKKTSMKP